MITHVAIIYQGKTYALPKPHRHCDVIRLIVKETRHCVGQNEQGFLDETGRFYDRRLALAHAIKCGQVKDLTQIRAKQLFSEDVW